MNRSDLFEIAKKNSKDGVLDREAMHAELVEYLKSEAGQKELRDTPRVTIDYGDNVFDNDYPLQEQSLERIADLIMLEV